jgi:hypothetical protein
MKTARALLILAASLAVPASQAQQSPNPPPPQPPQAQAQPAPCVNTPSNPNPSGNNPAIKVPGKWQQIINKQRQKLEATTGIAVPDPSTSIDQAANSKPAPCPSQAGSSKTALPTPAPALKLPPDITATLHCNPMTPSSKDASGRPTTLTLPDPHDFALPKATDFEVDNVVPDLAAKTPCYLVKVDPRTSKSFVAQ